MNKEENFVSGMGYLPTDVDHDYSFSLGIIKEAQAFGIRFGTLEFLVYHQLRWFENNGKMKNGFSVAGYKDYAKRFGVKEKSIINAFTQLRMKGAVELIACDGDEKVFRNKTRIWISMVRLNNIGCAAEAVEKIKLRGRGNRLPKAILSKENQVVELDAGKSEQSDLTAKMSDSSDKMSDSSDKMSDSSDLHIEKPPLSEIHPKCILNISSKEEEQAPKNASFELEDFEEKQKASKQTKPSKEKEELIDNINPLKGLKKKSSKKQKSLNQQITLVEAEDSRVKDEEGRVVGGNVLVERAYALWEEILGQPCKRDKWNSQAAWNMMRAKAKGEEWLRGMLMIVRECKKDPKADFRTKNIANLADLQKNWEYAMDWYRQKTSIRQESNIIQIDF